MPYRSIEPSIPADFVRAAQAHIEASGQPLLEYGHGDYSVTLYAGGENALYILNWAGWKPPFTTWRGLAAYLETPLDDLREQYGIRVNQADPDEHIDILEVIDLMDLCFRNRETVTGRVWQLFKS